MPDTLDAVETTQNSVEQIASMVKNEKLMTKVLKAAQQYFDRFSSQREEYETIWETNDYMYRCAQNRDINSTEITKGANYDTTGDSGNYERAATGSTLFFRQANQISSLLVSILRSKEVPFEYSPIVQDNVFLSYQEAADQASQWNAAARWTMKRDKFATKSISWANQLVKYGNIPIFVEWIHRKGKRKIRKPIYQTSVGNDGSPLVRLVGVSEEVQEVTTDNYPSVKILPVDSVWLDALIGDVQAQECIVIGSLHAKHHFYEEAYNGTYDLDQVRKIGKAHVWDQSANKKLLETRLENEGIDSTPTQGVQQYFQFDVFIRCPIENGEWQDDGPATQIYWLTAVGNTLGNAVPIRFDPNPDPDEEFSLEMVHDLPDDSDLAYHMSRGQVVRSNYSVECTLKNVAIDNMILVNCPPLKEIEGAVRGTDREFRPNQVFTMDNPDALQEFVVRDNTLQTVNLLDYIKNDTMTALSTDKLMLGEPAGARTSAYEISKLSSNTNSAHFISSQYSITQYLGFCARKYLSYWKAYADPDQILAITDAPFPFDVQPTKLYGEYDIEINIVDEFEDDIQDRQTINEALTLIAQNPALAAVHDIPTLMEEWWRKRRFNPAKFIKRPAKTDAERVAKMENISLMAGQMDVPQDGEDHDTHLNIHEAERMRYNGAEEHYPNIRLLDQHIAQTEMLMQQATSMQSAPLPQGPTVAQPGAPGGGPIAAAMGEMQGGGMGQGNPAGGPVA